MCGIVALMRFDGRPVDPGELAHMRDCMRHRGPDGEGLYVDGPIGIGHRRLSIIDLSEAGHQPMTNEDGSIWLVFNGEIYNYVELRAELVARGHTFTSNSDTEVIIHLYEEEGERCVERLGGMFAFVLWDARRREFFCARDRLGIKPFHYYSDRNQFACGSDMKAILAAPGVPRAADYNGIADYLFAGFPQSDRTVFAGIRQLPAGHSMCVNAAGVRLRKYWDVEYKYNYGRPHASIVSELTELLNDAVRMHCRSDAELGCHLSGGIDSSVVTGLAARYRDSLKTFSIRFSEGGFYDETAFAREVSTFAGAEYFEAVPNGRDFERLLPGLLYHMEMPLPNLGGFSYYTVSHLASQHVKVTLTGHGGDETFAGYPAQFLTAFGTSPFPEGDEPSAAPPTAFSRAKRVARRLARLGMAGVARQVGKRFRSQTPEELWVSLHCSQAPEVNPLVSRHLVTALQGYSPVNDYLTAFTGAPTTELLDRCLYHDLRCYLPGLLFMEDRVSMSVSVESRVPMLDHRIIEFMATVPPEQKVPGMVPKGLLREAAASALPDLIRKRRDKRPFPVPYQFWIRNVLKEMSQEVLLSPQSLDRGIIDADRLRRWDLQDHEIWAALNVELWFRLFIDRDPVWEERARELSSGNSRRAS